MFKRIRKDINDAELLGERYDAWDHETTSEIQLARLQRVWADCIEDIPYYAGLVTSGEAPKEIRSWNDFRSLPELRREILQQRPEEFVRQSGPPDLTRMTGGSTGNPVHFGVWNSEDRVIRLLKLVLWTRMGYVAGDRLFLIWGHSHLLGTGWRRQLNHLKRKLKDRLLGYLRVDAYKLDPERHREIAQSILRFRPAGLIGYAAALDSFVRSNEGMANSLRSLGLRFVMPCAEPLPKSDSLELLRSTFGCPVIQEFGGVDFGQVACRIDDGPFEVFPDQNVLEGLPSCESSDSEAVLVTSLYRRYLPLIRYRQGDLITGAKRDVHGHVRSFRTLDGRINDMIRLDSGTEIHSVSIFHCIHQETTILNIQMVLEDSGPQLRLATLDGRIAVDVEARVRQRLGQIASELAQLRIKPVTDIETTRAGKRRWFIDKRTRDRPCLQPSCD